MRACVWLYTVSNSCDYYSYGYKKISIQMSCSPSSQLSENFFLGLNSFSASGEIFFLKLEKIPSEVSKIEELKKKKMFSHLKKTPVNFFFASEKQLKLNL